MAIHGKPDKLKQKITFEVQQVFYTRIIYTLGLRRMETQKDKKLLSLYAIGKTAPGRTNLVPFVVIILSCVKVNLGFPAIALCWQNPAVEQSCTVCVLIKEPGLKEPPMEDVSQDLMTCFHGGTFFN